MCFYYSSSHFIQMIQMIQDTWSSWRSSKTSSSFRCLDFSQARMAMSTATSFTILAARRLLPKSFTACGHWAPGHRGLIRLIRKKKRIGLKHRDGGIRCRTNRYIRNNYSLYWTLLNIIEYYWILLNIIEWYWMILIEFHGYVRYV